MIESLKLIYNIISKKNFGKWSGDRMIDKLKYRL